MLSTPGPPPARPDSAHGGEDPGADLPRPQKPLYSKEFCGVAAPPVSARWADRLTVQGSRVGVVRYSAWSRAADSRGVSRRLFLPAEVLRTTPTRLPFNAQAAEESAHAP